ncbi:MAG: hypothetical protein K8R69_08780 [Deltaproteobacteria bacterium]|nr:hypothetical protein [Deltaproteobacteria bacterium]
MIRRKTHHRLEPDLQEMCRPWFQGIGREDFGSLPATQRRRCGDAYLPLSQVEDFELRIRHRGVQRRIRRGAQLTRFQATYRLADFYLPTLRHPPPGLCFLANSLKELLGGSPITLVLETEIGRGSAGFFRQGKHRSGIHLLDTLSARSGKGVENGIMDTATLYHELGHSLMFYLYGKGMPDYRGHPGHDGEAESYDLARTNPGAAWSEGFAGAIANLDYHSSRGIYSATYLPEQWFHLSSEARFSNEFVIAAALTDYLKSEVSAGEGQTRVIWDSAAESRLRKVFRCMSGSGLQGDFREFLREYSESFPEEMSRLRPILRDYGLEDFSSQKADE